MKAILPGIKRETRILLVYKCRESNTIVLAIILRGYRIEKLFFDSSYTKLITDIRKDSSYKEINFCTSLDENGGRGEEANLCMKLGLPLLGVSLANIVGKENVETLRGFLEELCDNI
ncbi:MAG: hypothetical protein ABWW69_04370, partial [Pyrodictiaceae archaeon]